MTLATGGEYTACLPLPTAITRNQYRATDFRRPSKQQNTHAKGEKRKSLLNKQKQSATLH